MMDYLDKLNNVGNQYFQRALHIEEIEYAEYDPKRPGIGINKFTGRPFHLDITMPSRILILGLTGCLIGDTLVATQRGDVEIRNLKNGDEVISYNLQTGKLETSPYLKYKIRKNVEMFKIYFKNKESVVCSKDHKFFKYTNSKLDVVKTESLQIGDKLLFRKSYDETVEISKIDYFDKHDAYDIFVLKNNNFLLSNGLLTKNSGKTFLTRALTDRLYQGGSCVYYCNDVKSEFGIMKSPVQDKYRKMLGKNEEPLSPDIQPLRPTFYKTLMPEDYDEARLEKDGLLKYKNNQWYSPDLTKMTESDFITLVRGSTMSLPQQVTLSEIYASLKRNMAKSGDFSFEMMMNCIQDVEDITDMQILAMKRRFKPLLRSHLYENDHKVNLVDMMNKTRFLSLNQEGFDAFNNTAFGFPEMVLSLSTRELINARRNNLIPELWIVMDEAARFIDKDMENSIKKETVTSFELDRRYKVNYVVITQFLHSMPERIIDNSRYIILPAAVDLETMKDAIRMLGLFRNQQTINNDANYLKSNLDPSKFEWLILDRLTGDKVIIRPYAPLSWHLE